MSDDYFYMLGNEKPRPLRAPSLYLPPEEEEALTGRLARQTFGAIETLGKILDTPGSIARGVLADDPASGFYWDSDRRVSGEELLDHYGIQYDNPYTKAAAGFVAEIATDPLALISGPMKALTPAGKAAKAAGLLDLAPVAAARRMGGYANAAKTLTGSYTDDAFRKILPEMAQRAGQPPAAAVQEALKVRPLLGPRLSRSIATLDDVVQSADDQADAMARLQDWLEVNKLNYDDIKDQPLGGFMGFGAFEPSAVWMPRGAAPVLDAMDMLGQRVAWSAPVRYGSAWFDERMRQQAGVADQIDMLRFAGREADELRQGRIQAINHLAKFRDASPLTTAALGADGLLGSEGGRVVRRLSENVPNQADKALLQSTPGLQDAVDSWDSLRKGMLKEARQLGLKRRKYEDRFGVKMSPRYAAEIELPEQSSGLGRSLYNTVTNEGKARVWYLQTPGGSDELGEISTLPIVREHARLKGGSPYSNEQIGQEIQRWLKNRYGNKYGPEVIGDRQATLMANFMRNLKEELPADYALFSEHPLNAQARLIQNHRRNVAAANFVYDKLAEHAVMANSQSIRGGGWRSLENSVQNVARTIGLQTHGNDIAPAVRKQIVDRIAQRFPHLSRADIDLAKMAIPQSVFERLNKVQSVFNTPKAWKDVWGLFEKFTTVFKAFVLAWPSRHVRDAYSNAFSVWLETGNASDTLMGLGTATKVLAGDYGKAIPLLRQIPRYARLATDMDVERLFMQDAGSTGVLSTLASSDLLTARQHAAITELMPGATPVRMSDAIQEMTPDGTRTGAEMVKDFFTIQGVSSKWQTKNALLNASQKINDANDSIARLGGFIALLKQGVAPDQAAQRITSALVDYSSITDIERSVFKVIFPWWTYSSRIGKYVVQNLMERPGGQYGQMIRAMNTLQQSDEDQYIPTALRQQFAVRVPDALLPYIGREPGSETTTYFKDLDLPGVDVLSLFVPGSMGLDVTETAQNIAQQAHPLLRTVGEMSTGIDFFSKRPLEEAVTPLDRIYQSAFGTPARLSPAAKAVIQNIPGIQRLISLGGGLADQRIPFEDRVLKQAINNLTGVKIQDVDPDWMYSDISRKIGQNLKGYMSSRKIEFIPEELLPYVPPDLQRQYLLKKSVDRKAQEMKRAKREAREFQNK